jgi:Alginate lyase
MWTRRQVLVLPMGIAVSSLARAQGLDLVSFERARVLRIADKLLHEAPVTVTSASSPRSAGGPHDYFSEGDYWWPDPQNPEGPYIQRDGESNPDNFLAHRRALMRLSVQVPALAAAWLVTKDRGYSDHARRHLRAWFRDESTRMTPHLLYSQAIKGRFTGRGTGIIDTVHLVEVARAITVLERGKQLPDEEQTAFREWFSRYLTWMTTHQYGIDEREARNNHGTCWVMQVAEFARYVGRDDLVAYCRDRYRTVLVPNQIAADGSFPEELRRTKPYGYSLFNLDGMAMCCEILSAPQDNLWTFELADRRGIRTAFAFLVPFIADKKKWTRTPDVMYFDEWPVRQPALFFGGLGLHEPSYIELWKKLNPDPTVEEVVRNYFIRQPVLWSRT